METLLGAAELEVQSPVLLCSGLSSRKMIMLTQMLSTTHISSLIKAKPGRKSHLISLPTNATIHYALAIFLTQNISAIPIESESGGFAGMLSVVDVLKFIMHGAPESFYARNVDSLLAVPISSLIAVISLKRAIIVSDQMTLLDLVTKYWYGECHLDREDVDCVHLLVKCNEGLDVVTPTDFLRYLRYFCQGTCFLSTVRASDITSSIEITQDTITTPDENAWIAFGRLARSSPHYLLAVVDECTGALLSSLSPDDMLPADLHDLEESISLLRRPGISLYAFVHAVRQQQKPADLDPILLYDHLTISDLIEKMTTMQLRHLWRVSPDRQGRPLGVVGVIDIINHLHKMFSKFNV